MKNRVCYLISKLPQIQINRTKYLDVIIDNLLNERCVLMLGTEIMVNEKGIPSQQDLFRYFETETNLSIEQDIDNFVIFKNKSSKTFFYTDLKKYYEKNSQITDIYKRIAQIPFHLGTCFKK